MLNLVLKQGDQLQIGDNVVIKLQSESRAQLAIDAPRDVDIKRIPVGGSDTFAKDASSKIGKKIIVVNNGNTKKN